MEVLAIIPARVGSKGIPMKNIMKINDKPLIEYTIRAAKKSKLVDRIIVSTDSKKIANISKLLGAEVPFLRPKKIATDKSSNYQVVSHTLDFLQKNESYVPEMIVILQPTNPLRTSKIIDKGITSLKNSNADTLVTVKTVKHHPYSSFWKKNKFLKPFIKNFYDYRRRQTRPPLYHNTGDLFIFWNETLKKFNSFYGKKIQPLIITDDFTSIDIDSEFDAFVCEAIMKSKKWNLE